MPTFTTPFELKDRHLELLRGLASAEQRQFEFRAKRPEQLAGLGKRDASKLMKSWQAEDSQGATLNGRSLFGSEFDPRKTEWLRRTLNELRDAGYITIKKQLSRGPFPRTGRLTEKGHEAIK